MKTTRIAATSALIMAFAASAQTVSTPEITGLTNAADFRGSPLVSGSVMTLWGNNLAAQTALALQNPWPSTINGTQVLVDSLPASLQFVSPSQINFQVPYGLSTGVPHTLQVTRVDSSGSFAVLGNKYSATADILTVGLFRRNGSVIIQNWPDYNQNTPANPVRPEPNSRLSYITVYASGIGPIQSAPAIGQTAPITPPFATVDPSVQITIVIDGSLEFPTGFAGLVPGQVGVGQLNFTIPAFAVGGAASGQHTAAIRFRALGKQTDTETFTFYAAAQ